MRLSGEILSVSLAPNSVLSKIFSYPVANINLPANAAPMNHQISVIRNDSSFSSFNIFNRTNPSQALLLMVDEGRNSNFGGYYKSKCSSDSFEKQVSSREINDDDYPENLGKENDKERQRRRKIGLANKGKVPWNKGKKHNMETRKRIKQRTIEALRDPKVRRKMSEHPRTHSISIAAKKGAKEEQELDWDSYDKIKQEMLHQKLQRVAEKAKLKEMRAENSKKRKVEGRVHKKEKGDDGVKSKKMQVCSTKRNGWKRKAKEGEDIQREMKKLTAIERSRLKQRLKKIRKKISINGAVAAQGSITLVIPQNTSWEKLDLDLIKKGQIRKEVSLADQIQVAKNRKAESMTCKVLVASTFMYQCTGGAEK